MKKILSWAMVALLLFALPACSSKEEDEPVKEHTMLDLDLSQVNSLVGSWIIYSRLNETTGEFVSVSDPEIWEIKADGTMIRHVGVYAYNYTYTYDNGVLLTHDTEGYLWTYKFSHYNEYRLQVERIQEVGFSATYLISTLESGY